MYNSIFKWIPTNYISYIVGKVSNMPLPSTLARLVIGAYVKCFSINISECAKDISEYRCLGEFFVRELKAGVRPIEADIVSPVDALIAEFGSISQGQILQAKGKTYSVVDLVGSQSLGERYLNGYFITFYLSPADYHHIHSPVSGVITDTYYMRGNLWPVTNWGARTLDDLYVRNERVVTAIESETCGVVSVVSVGATNVGTISLNYDSLVTNQHPSFLPKLETVEHRSYSDEKKIAVGGKLATFCMGSTVIVLFEPERFSPGAKVTKNKIKFGESLSDVC